MMVQRVLFTGLVVILAGLLTACGGGGGGGSDDPNAETVDVASYVNFNSRWTYQVTDDPAGMIQQTYEVAGTFTYNSKECYGLLNYTTQGAPNRMYYYTTDMTYACYLMGYQDNYQSADETNAIYQPSELPVFLATFVSGNEYSYVFELYIDGQYDSGGFWKVTQQSEAVNVPAGNYTDCYKVTIKTETDYHDDTLETSWWCKDVGLVKRIEPNGKTLELISYQP
jgi:hypothetical protein